MKKLCPAPGSLAGIRAAATRRLPAMSLSVGHQILLSCLGFVTIIALLGLGATRQSDQLGRLAVTIYDHSFVGTSYVNQAEAGFLRLVAHDAGGAPFATPARRAQLRAILDQLDVAIERAGTAQTQGAAAKVRAMLAELPGLPASRLPDRIAQVDRAIVLLVRNYASDGLQARDEASGLAARSFRQVLAEIGLSFALAIGLGVVMSRNLGPPLVALVGIMHRLTEGELEQEVPPRLSGRNDEIGAMARATMFFRDTMLKNVAAAHDRVKLQSEHWTSQLHAEREKAAIDAKSDFLATMSHEIRTPMNGVVTIADLLADTALGADQLRMVNIIRTSAKWLIRVINDILDFSKLEAHQLEIEHAPFMLDEVVDAAVQVLDAKAREKNLLLTVVGRDLPGLCRIGDPLRVRQILLNLLGNAVKFTAAGSVTLDVRADAGRVILCVIDTGIGIPAEKIDSLFQPYNQVRSDTARAYGGTGLGLSITKTLVALMGGDLTVTSAAGRGSRFTVSLSLPGDAASLCKGSNGPAASRRHWRKPDAATAAAQAAIVLCAEDNAINRDVLSRVLDRLGVTYDMAEDGQAALAMLDRARHGLVLTDGQMPLMDGWQVAQAIRQQEAENTLSRLPVLLLTANALGESDRRTRAVGMDAVLTKPVNVDALEAALLDASPILGALRIAAGPNVAASPAGAADAPAPAPTPTPSPNPSLIGADNAPVADPAIDVDSLIQLVGDDPETLAGLLETFQVSVTAQHDQIRAAAALDDLELVARHAHAIKGAARYAGAKQLASICETLELRARRRDTAASMSVDFAALDAAVARLPAEIAAALSNHAAPARAAAAA